MKNLIKFPSLKTSSTFSNTALQAVPAAHIANAVQILTCLTSTITSLYDLCIKDRENGRQYQIAASEIQAKSKQIELEIKRAINNDIERYKLHALLLKGVDQQLKSLCKALKRSIPGDNLTVISQIFDSLHQLRSHQLKILASYGQSKD